MRQQLAGFWQQFTQWPHLIEELTARRMMIFAVLALLCIGTTMIASASMPFAAQRMGDPLYFITRQMFYLGAAAVVAVIAIRIPLRIWFSQTFCGG